MSPSDVVEQNESQLSVLKRRERKKKRKSFFLKIHQVYLKGDCWQLNGFHTCQLGQNAK